jgi:signal transduction histidine kinase
MPSATHELAARMSAALHERSEDLAQRWLDRLAARRVAEPARVFPTASLLDRVPIALKRIGDALTRGEDPTASALVRDDMRSLALLRREQGYGPEELVTELDILGDVLFEELQGVIDQLPEVSPSAVVEVSRRLQHALYRMSVITIEAFTHGLGLEQAERAQLLSTFASDVSHELRNRLNAATILLGTLSHDLRPGLSPEHVATLDRLERTLQRAGDVVADVCSVAVAQGRTEPSEGRRQPLSEVIEAVMADMGEWAQNEAVRIDGPAHRQDLPVDGARVQLVLVNLIANGIKYADARKTDRWVRLDVLRGDRPGEHWVRVSDNGIGIPPDATPHIFDRSVRGEDPQADGRGLGLALARTAVEQLGGRIWVDSEPGEGSVFTFSLPEPARDLVHG